MLDEETKNPNEKFLNKEIQNENQLKEMEILIPQWLRAVEVRWEQKSTNRGKNQRKKLSKIQTKKETKKWKKLWENLLKNKNDKQNWWNKCPQSIENREFLCSSGGKKSCSMIFLLYTSLWLDQDKEKLVELNEITKENNNQVKEIHDYHQDRKSDLGKFDRRWKCTRSPERSKKKKNKINHSKEKDKMKNQNNHQISKWWTNYQVVG
jgi:hypothetical protein